MTPLTKYINRKNRRIQTLEGKIADHEEKIANIKSVKKIYPGRTPYSDKKTIRQEKRIKKIRRQNKRLQKRNQRNRKGPQKKLTKKKNEYTKYGNPKHSNKQKEDTTQYTTKKTN